MAKTYTNRACHKCGARHPQNEMVKREITKTSASFATNGSKNHRVYARGRTVYYCKECAPPSSLSVLLILGVIGYCVGLYYGVF